MLRNSVEKRINRLSGILFINGEARKEAFEIKISNRIPQRHRAHFKRIFLTKEMFEMQWQRCLIFISVENKLFQKLKMEKLRHDKRLLTRYFSIFSQ